MTPTIYIASTFLLSGSLIFVIAQVTTSTAAATFPKLVDGNDKYQLLGCYSELNASIAAGGNRAVGDAGQYINPNSSTANLTVGKCLDDCDTILSPGGGGTYTYAAVEDSRECFCGFKLSNYTTAVSSQYCSLPCTGDSAVSCGGSGYLVLYGLRSASLTVGGNPHTATSTSKTSPSTTSSTSTSTSTSSTASLGKKGGLSNAALGGVIAVSVVAFLALLILAFLLFKRRQKAKRLEAENIPLSILGGNTTRQERLANRKHIINLTPDAATLENERMFGAVGTGYRGPSSPQAYRNMDGVSNMSSGSQSNSWRQTSLPPISPEDVTPSVEIGDFKSDVQRGDLETGNGGFMTGDGRRAFKYPGREVAELSGETPETPFIERRETFASQGREARSPEHRELESPILGSEGEKRGYYENRI